MTKRFTLDETFMITDNECLEIISPLMNSKDVAKVCELLNELAEENEQLKIAVKDKENLISICEKKFKELGYLITCNDDGYTVEKI